MSESSFDAAQRQASRQLPQPEKDSQPEAALLATERISVLETLFELAPDAIFVAGGDDKFIEVNDRACDLLGYGRAELLEKTITDLLVPEEWPRLEPIRQVLTQGGTQTQIWRHRHKDGSEVIAEVSAKILPDGRWVAFVRDLRDRLQVESDRQQALVNLQVSEERLQLALHATGQGIWDWDLKADVLIWDDRCKAIFGLSLDAAVNYEWFINTLHPDDRPRVTDAVTVALRDRTDFDEVYRTLYPDGTICWVLARGRGYYDAAGQPYRMSGTVLDITERKEAELAFQQKAQEAEAAKQTLEALMTYIPEGVTIADAPDVTIRYVSRYGQQLAGRSPEVLEGIAMEEHAQTWGIFYPDGVTPAENEVLPLTRAVQQGEVVIDEEWVLRQPDSNQIVVLCNAGPIYNPQGEITGGVIAWRDISDRKQTENLLREKEQQFQDLSNSMPQLVWTCNAEGKLDYVNRQWTEYSGLTLVDSLNPEAIVAIYHPDDVQPAFEQWAIAVANKQVYEQEFRLRRAADGAFRWFLIRAIPILDQQGQVLRWYGTSTDIHQRKIAQLNAQFLKDLDLRLRQLSDADAMVSEVVSSVGDYLKVDYCLWHTVDLPADCTTVEQDWRRQPDFQSFKGVYRLSEFILPQLIRHYQTGQPLVIADVAINAYTAPVAHNFAQLNIRAILGVPYIEAGHWIAALAVNSREVRQWRSDEVSLLQEVVARLWAIVEQTRALAALRESESRFRMLADNIAQLAWTADATGWIFWYNQRWFDYTGTTLAEMQGWGWQKVHHPDFSDRVVERFRHCVQTGETWEDTFPLRSRDGHYRWFLSRAIPVRDAEGHILRWFGTNTDITERRQAQEQLRDGQERLQAALIASGTGTFRWDIRTNALDWDENLDRLFGLPPGQTARSLAAFIQLVHPGDRQSVIDCCARCASAGADFDLDFRVVYPDGSIRWLSDKGKTVFDQDGKPLYMTGACVDITDRKQAEAALQQQTAELIQANRLKDEFLAALSHELRTPLNPILGWTKLLRGQHLSAAKTVQALEVIERSAKQQLALVDDLLDVSSVIQGKLSLDYHPVDLKPTLDAAIATVRFAAQAKGITIQVSQSGVGVTETLALTVMGDSDRLQQVFWNLLSNAIKFTPDGGRVEVNLAVIPNGNDHRYAQVRVADNGLGIAAEFLPYVFDHFRQADGSMTRKHGGLGLGLSIVRHLVELQGGTVMAESPGAGQGAIFTVKLPLAAAVTLPETDAIPTHSAAIAAAPTGSSSPPNAPLSGVHILVVDDDADNLELLHFLLSGHGATVSAVNSAPKALQLFASTCFNLIVSDIGMPEMNGYEFIQEVRVLPQGQQIPALALTAFAHQEDQEKVFSAGFQAYMAKPVDPLQLLEALTQLSHVVSN